MDTPHLWHKHDHFDPHLLSMFSTASSPTSLRNGPLHARDCTTRLLRTRGGPNRPTTFERDFKSVKALSSTIIPLCDTRIAFSQSSHCILSPNSSLRLSQSLPYKQRRKTLPVLDMPFWAPHKWQVFGKVDHHGMASIYRAIGQFVL